MTQELTQADTDAQPITVTVIDEGDVTESETPVDEISEDFQGGMFSHTALTIGARRNVALNDGSLVDEAEDEHIVERALEEDDVFFARIVVPQWFQSKDADAAQTFKGDYIDAIVEDYSEKAWRIIASERSAVRRTSGLLTYDYEWTFVPKSLTTMVRVNVPEDATMEDVDEFEGAVLRRTALDRDR